MSDRLVEYIRENKIEAFRRTMMSHERFDLDELSCLHWAVLYARVEMVEILLKCGADVNRPGLYNNQTPLNVASVVCADCVVDLFHMLLSAGANPNGEIVKFTVNDQDEADEFPQIEVTATPLIKVVDVGNSALVNLLIEAGADVNLADSDGYTPLTKAIERSNEELVKLLLSQGASVEITGPGGCSPYDMATEQIRQILSAPRQPADHSTANGKDQKGSKKKGFFKGLFSSGNKNSNDGKSPAKEVLLDFPGVDKKVSSLGSPVVTPSKNKSGVSSAAEDSGTPKSGVKTNVSNVCSSTPQKVLLSTTQNTPSKISTTTPRIGTTTPRDTVGSTVETEVAVSNAYITIHEHNRQMQALESRIAALEKGLEAQNRIIEQHSQQMNVLQSSYLNRN